MPFMARCGLSMCYNSFDRSLRLVYVLEYSLLLELLRTELSLNCHFLRLVTWDASVCLDVPRPVVIPLFSLNTFGDIWQLFVLFIDKGRPPVETMADSFGGTFKCKLLLGEWFNLLSREKTTEQLSTMLVSMISTLCSASSFY